MKKLKRKYRNKPLPFYRRRTKKIPKLLPNKFMEAVARLIAGVFLEQKKEKGITMSYKTGE